MCSGTGKIPVFKTAKNYTKVILAHALRKDGHSIRDIMKLMGYKSPRSVQYLLEQRLKK